MEELLLQRAVLTQTWEVSVFRTVAVPCIYNKQTQQAQQTSTLHRYSTVEFGRLQKSLRVDF